MFLSIEIVPRPGIQEGDWLCPACGVVNGAQGMECARVLRTVDGVLDLEGPLTGVQGGQNSKGFLGLRAN